MSSVFHTEGVGYHETEIADDLYAFSIDPQRALEEYLQLQIKIKPIYDLMFKNRIFTYFAAATPGLRELVTIGKVWELAQLDRRVKRGAKYDLVIVDAPATGHGIGILRTPKTFSDIARVGPIKRQADAIYEFITDSDLTSVCAVAWPEEMPVNETLDLRRNLHEELGLDLDRVFMNGLYPELFSDDEAATIRERLEHDEAANGAGSVVLRAALRAALSEHRRATAQREQLRTPAGGVRRGRGRAAVPVPRAGRHGGCRGAGGRDRGPGLGEWTSATSSRTSRSASARAPAASARRPPRRRSRWAWPPGV